MELVIRVAWSRISYCARICLTGLVRVVSDDAHAMMVYVPFPNVAMKRIRHAIRTIRTRICVRLVPTKGIGGVVARWIRIAVIAVSNTCVSQFAYQLCLFSNVDLRYSRESVKNENEACHVFGLFLICCELFCFKRGICFENVRSSEVMFLFGRSDTIRNHVFKLKLRLDR